MSDDEGYGVLKRCNDDDKIVLLNVWQSYFT